jgi:hypothetical protein
MIKRYIYIGLCVFLGVLLTTILHGVGEQAYIALLLSDWDRYAFGLSFETLLQIHHVLSFLLLGIGVIGGYLLGVRWWRAVYEAPERS